MTQSCWIGACSGMVMMLATTWMAGCDRSESPSHDPADRQSASSPATQTPDRSGKSSMQGASAGPTVLYANDFTAAKTEAVPQDMFVLDGGFAVRTIEGDRMLELPGKPIDAYAVLFGPNRVDGVEVSARIFTRRRGRRYSRFGVGLGGVGGVKLRVDAAADQLTLYNDDVPIIHVHYVWPVDQWVWLKLRVDKVGKDHWRYEGKAWTEGAAEPGDWMIRHETDEPPIDGQGSVWGTPYAEQPICFDDIRYVQVSGSAKTPEQ